MAAVRLKKCNTCQTESDVTEWNDNGNRCPECGGR